MDFFARVTDTPTTEKQAASVIDTVTELLEQGPQQRDKVLAIVKALVADNEKLLHQLAQAFSKRRKGESISPDQLQLLLDDLQAHPKGAEGDANQHLQEIAERESKDLETSKPERQPPVRKPAPDHLERVCNPIPVPDEERKCPQCGADRKCIRHDKADVIELIPAKVIVRVDTREVLACERCEGEIVCAPAGDKVVSGGKYGPNLVADLVVGKYDEGLPLDRQRRSLEHLGLSMSTSAMSDQIGWATDLLQPL